MYTPQDKAIQTPNSDSPYTFLGADLRAEPVVIGVPAMPKGRYHSLQFIDMYTHNFAYVGSRATGSEAGNYLLAGPAWQGPVPKGIKSVIRSETHFAFVLYRTQLFGTSDLEEVKKIQARYTVRPLSQFAGTTPPPPAAPVDFMKPLSADAQKASPEFFTVLNFLFRFTPIHPSETALMEHFAKAGLGPGQSFDVAALSTDQRQAVEQGVSDAWKAFTAFKREEIDTGKKSSADGFGTREFLHNDYMTRMSSAILGIYGNSKEEANYPAYFVDSERNPLNGATSRYIVKFLPGQLPPVNAFWSLTMYELPASLLTENPINRYLINSPMEPNLIRDADGGITLYIQHESPGKSKESNWLPAPEGPFFMVLREALAETGGAERLVESPASSARREMTMGALHAWIQRRPSMKSPRPAAAYLFATALALTACGRSQPAATSAAPASAPTTAPPAAPTSAAVAPAVPDLGDPTRWKKSADGKVIVTPDNFIRAESDVYMAAQVKDGAFGQFKHTREVAPVDKQLIVRLNRDTIYSSAVFDLDAGPVTIALPDSRGRFLSALAINEDHYNPAVFYDPGAHILTRQDAGTRYVMVGVRIFVDPNNPKDVQQGNALQDAVTASQPGGRGTFQIPNWDPVSQVREALMALSNTLPDLRYAAGPNKTAVDPVRRIAAAASGWGLNPDRDAI